MAHTSPGSPDLLPLAFAINQQSAMWEPLAAAIIAGLVLQCPMVQLILDVAIGRLAHLSRQTWPVLPVDYEDQRSAKSYPPIVANSVEARNLPSQGVFARTSQLHLGTDHVERAHRSNRQFFG
jgi:hypothetical protein